MTIELANPITGHALTLMPPTTGSPTPFGWIQLLNGATDAGYIYLSDDPVEPHLNSSKRYIVTSMPFASLHTMLHILQTERNLQIRFFDPESAGVGPTVFVEGIVKDVGDQDARSEAGRLRRAPA